MTAVQDAEAAARPASGIALAPGQLTRLRKLRALSGAGLAERAGELLFDRDRFAEVMSGRVQPDAQMARSVWMALDAEPRDLIRGLPRRLPAPDAPLWLRRNPGKWTLDLDAVNRLRGERSRLDAGTGEIRAWTPADLADAAARHWMSRDMVNKMERGARRPSPETLAAICQALGCEPRELLPGSGPLSGAETLGEPGPPLLAYAEMRAHADAHGISYRNQSGRIQYRKLREAYENRAAGREVR
jgi:transcriptional regulator with XRE-family HTH domain